MHPLSLKGMTWSWGLFGAVTFVACVVYGLVTRVRGDEALDVSARSHGSAARFSVGPVSCDKSLVCS